MAEPEPDAVLSTPSPSGSQGAKDLLAGAAGGIAQVLIGQPFDIVKVRLQTVAGGQSAAAVAGAIWRGEGARAFYKGTLTPLVGIGGCVAIQFGAFHAARRWLETRGYSGTSAAVAAGACAGVANSALSAPIEHVRIRLQTQPHAAAARLYAGPWGCARQLGARGLFRGGGVTVAREAVAYGVWFGVFEALMRADAARRPGGRTAVPTWLVAAYGGLAGEALWLASYPLDVVKTKMQTDGLGPARRYASARDCAAQTWRAHGIAGFWKGIGPTLLRAMPVSAGTFAVVEMAMRALG